MNIKQVYSHNKQNQSFIPPSPSLYQRKRYTRDKSPLHQYSNDEQRYQVKNDSQYSKSPLKYSNRLVQQSYIYPLSNSIISKQLVQIQSASDFQKIKPFTLQERKTAKPDDQQSKNYYNSSKSRPRQNAKRIQFSAKVSKLDKINSQITNLLSFIDNNNSKKKQNQQEQKIFSNYKPRYDNYNREQRRSNYTRKINNLQEPKNNEIILSRFQINQNQNNDKNKSQRKIPKYEYSTDDFQMKIKKQIKQSTRTPKKIDIKQFTQKSQIQVKKPSNVSHEEKQCQTKTSLAHIKMKAYQQSIKKRDEEIKNFQKSITKKIDPSQVNIKSASQFNKIGVKNKEFQPLTRQKFRQIYKNRQIKQLSPQKQQQSIYLTVEQVEVYKDINKKSKYQRNNLNNLDIRIPQQQKSLCLTPINIRQSKLSQKKSNEMIQRSDFVSTQLKANHSSQFFRNQHFPYSQVSNNYNRSSFSRQPEPTINKTVKIQQQIQKIKNELKSCKQQKTNLRSKYSNLLNQPISEINQKKISLPAQKAQNRSPSKSNIKLNKQDERFYETNSHKNAMNFIKNQHQYLQNFNELRKNLAAEYKSPIQSPKQFQRRSQFKINLQKVQITKPETTRLGTLLGQKIQIDIKLRQQREKFIKLENNQKWELLSSYLSKQKGIRKSGKDWQSLLMISSQEHNPFSSNKFFSSVNTSIDQVIRSLADSLMESIKFYQISLKHSFSLNLLQKQKFDFHELDLSSKGYLSLQDIICFVNLHSGKFYRNRDIIFLIKWILQDSQQKSQDTAKMDKIKISYQMMWNTIINKN